ncbi:uncharacterized protein [Rutidosis leptorrhynchoides]|uniref:uncharacterized protein n=1 Tax=Rutidosis leptorrhynchoides TaxID=125765 RepID=UPI003A9A00DA
MCSISFNIRGLGQTDKINWLKQICQKENPVILGLQETKCGQSDDSLIESFWYNTNFKFIQKDSLGASGGLLLIWDSSSFIFDSAIEGEFFIAIKGKWAGSDTDMIMINVYGPHPHVKKLRFWSELSKLIDSIDIPHIIFGDFNEVRSNSERLNCYFKQTWADKFNNFINSANLIDLPLGGKKFTRMCLNTQKFSKLDRFLISGTILNIWPDISSKTLERDLSDHCPILLKNSFTDFGPKPTRVFNSWLKLKNANDIIKNTWQISVNGNRPDCIFRNKLKNVKLELKKCSLQLSNLDSEIISHLDASNEWEKIAETRQLTEFEHKNWINEKVQHIEKKKKEKQHVKTKSPN